MRSHATHLCAIAMLWLGAPASAGAVCEAWPGEPAPVPTVDDADPVRARWAELRVAELREVAERLEEQDPGAAHVTWTHVLCLDPGNGVAPAGLRRVQPVATYRPEVEVVRAAPEVAPAASADEALLSAGSVIVVRAAPPSPPPRPAAEPQPSQQVAARTRSARPAAPPPEPEPPAVEDLEAETPPVPEEPAELLARADPLIEQAQEQLRGAYFEEALAAAREADAALAGAQATPGVRERRTRAAVAAATAQLALGRSEAARDSLERALDATPDLSLDTATAPPKLVRALESARAAR